MKKLVYPLLNLVFAIGISVNLPPAMATTEISLNQVYIRKMELTKVAAPDYGPQNSQTQNYEISSESFESWDVLETFSNGKKVAPVKEESFIYREDSVIPMAEIWSFDVANPLVPIGYYEGGPARQSLAVYQDTLKEERIAGSSHVLYNFMMNELPQLNLKQVVPEITTKESSFRCRPSKLDLLHCEQSLSLELKIKTEQYESMRRLGIDPILIMRNSARGV